ncbi:MAG: hypothetical protein EOP04_01135 [Proteobacteria bacterium]|nr:MAG: hypothetical protein EOP04_01135 [Pseudomonadota bacterium]
MGSHVILSELRFMSQKTSVAVYFAGKEVLVPAQVDYFSTNERMKKGAQALCICWAVGIAFLIVPAIHFIASPLAFILGPIMAIFVYQKVKKLPKKVVGDINCGNCGASSHFEFFEVKPPLFEACHACRTGYEVLWPPRSEGT